MHATNWPSACTPTNVYIERMWDGPAGWLGGWPPRTGGGVLVEYNGDLGETGAAGIAIVWRQADGHWFIDIQLPAAGPTDTIQHRLRTSDGRELWLGPPFYAFPGGSSAARSAPNDGRRPEQPRSAAAAAARCENDTAPTPTSCRTLDVATAALQYEDKFQARKWSYNARQIFIERFPADRSPENGYAVTLTLIHDFTVWSTALDVTAAETASSITNWTDIARQWTEINDDDKRVNVQTVPLTQFSRIWIECGTEPAQRFVWVSSWASELILEWG